MAANMSASFHLRDTSKETDIRIEPAQFGGQYVVLGEVSGNYIAVYLNDEQLKQLHEVTGHRLGEIAAQSEPPAVSEEQCVCIHHAGDSVRCPVHAAVP